MTRNSLHLVSLALLLLLICSLIFIHINKQKIASNETREFSHETRVETAADNWLNDDDLMNTSRQELKSTVCDFEIITEKEFFSDPFRYIDKPFVFKGLALNWSATSRWRRKALLDSYGNRRALTGSESSIVYSGGTAGVAMSIRSILNNMRNITSQRSSNLFTFDVSVLKSIPELKKDFPIPKAFQSWDNFHSESRGFSWHLLSLGPSKAGLPLHMHGTTWLAVVHGAKRWFVYPPGSSPPKDIEKDFNPLDSVHDWYQTIYPKLINLPKPKPWIVDEDLIGYRPLECLQESGDVLYLPKGWVHMTMNIGETIGIGGQAAFTAVERYEHAIEVLSTNPNNYDGLKAASLGLAHFADEESNRLKHELITTSSGLIQLRPNNLQHLVSSTNDTWLIAYAYLKDHSRESEYLMNILNEVASSDIGRQINIGVIEINKYPQLIEEHELKDDCSRRENVDDPNGILPCLRIFPGAPSFDVCDDVLFTYKHHASKFLTSIQRRGVIYHKEITSDAISEYLMDLSNKCILSPGSILTVSVKSRNWFQQALKYIRKAIDIQPYNSEINSFYAEVLGYANNTSDMIQVLQSAENMYDNLIEDFQLRNGFLPMQSIAAIYQKIGHTYLIKGFANQSLSPIKKSLNYYPFYAPALTSLAIAYNILDDTSRAEAALDDLERVEPGSTTARDIRRMMRPKEPLDRISNTKVKRTLQNPAKMKPDDPRNVKNWKPVNSVKINVQDSEF